MVVQDIMARNPIHIGPTASVFAALSLLNDLDVRHLIVMENGELKGIISDRDLRSFSASEMNRLAVAESLTDLSTKLKQRVSEFMNPNVFFVDPESPLSDAIAIMLDHKVGAVPVVDPDMRVTGIVSYIDILREASKVL
jgi:acetoin utilization protein AcuB